MSQVFGTLCCFSSRLFLKQLASHVSAATLHLVTIMLSCYTYILVLCQFLWKIRDCH